METLTKTNNSAQKLGYKKLESAIIVSSLNTALSTYQIFFHKLQTFHWNVLGGDFFDIHDLTQEMYERGLKDIDELAERVRIFGETPNYSLKEYMVSSLIKETTHDKSAEFMAMELIQDIEKLCEAFLDVHEKASDHGDIGSTYMISEMMKFQEENHWKLSAWTSRKFKS